VCKAWIESYESFYADMGERPKDMTIDRIDNNGNYSCGHCDECIANGWPANCRWATRKEQSNNTRSVRFIEINGVTRSVTDWCEIKGINYGTLRTRTDRGMDLKQAILKPIKKVNQEWRTRNGI